MQRTCIVICGPTAVGKTDVAVALALSLSTSILSADSRQCYRELSIGVAKPSPEQLNAVPHDFIDSHSLHEPVSAAVFARYGREALDRMFRQSPVAVVSGGTGLYIRALCEGLDQMPEIPASLRADVSRSYADHGLAWLDEQLRKEDPVFSASGDMRNPSRMLRALEVIRHTGRSITDFQTGQPVAPDFRVCYVGLNRSRPELYERIRQRTLQLFQEGWVEEVRGLTAFRTYNALQTVGYREIFGYLDGTLTYDECVEKIMQSTRHYAKRQLTWFRKVDGLRWLDLDAGESAAETAARIRSII